MDDYERAIDNSRIVINLIKSKPELYDPNHQEYANRFAHVKAWKELAESLNVSVPDFKAKWASLRNSYARSIRSGTAINGKPRTKWYLEDSMSFIKEHIRKKSERRSYLLNYGNNAESNDDIDIDDTNFVDQVKNEALPDVTPEGSGLMCHDDQIDNPDREKNILNDTISLKKRKRIDFDDISEPNELNNLFQSITSFFNLKSEQLHLTSDDLYFQSIQKDFEKLTEKKKRKFKLITLNAINDLLDEDEAEENNLLP